MKFFTAMALFGGISSVAALVPVRQYNAAPSSYPAPTTTKASSTSSSSTVTFSRPTAAPTICLTNTTANYLVNGFASLLTAYNNDTANALLSSDFTDTSDSSKFDPTFRMDYQC